MLWWWRSVLLVEKPEYVEKTLTYIKSLVIIGSISGSIKIQNPLKSDI
jgi:hypothetical protein